MRLRDLDAHFVFAATKTGCRFLHGESVGGAQGVIFQCPKCAEGKEVVVDHERETGGQPRRFVVGAHYIRVFFSNPSGEIAPADADLRDDGTPNPRWTMEGTTLDGLSLTPSINCDIPWKDKDGVEHESSCKFHGYVKNGDAA